MSMSTVPPEVTKGLRNRWYILGTSDLVSREPVALKVLGEELVLWRDDSGAPHLFPDTCAHRRARLSKGFIADGRLRCAYHGWEYDGTGQCRSVPTQGGECQLSREVKLISYPVVERAGYLWAYIGDVAKFPPPPLVLPYEFEDPAWSTFPESVDWNTNWLLILENLVDVMHAPFLHARSWFNRQGPLQDRLQVEETASGFMVRRIGQQGRAFDWNEVNFDSILYCRFEIPYNKWAGPGGPLRIVGSVTPVDEGRTRAFFTRFRKVSGWRRALWRALYRARLRQNHLHVLSQDRTILESQRGIAFARNGEWLAPSDLGVVALRQAVLREYGRQKSPRGAETQPASALAVQG
jgi:phenylpropionate dioxygenase-like ring-hydroxylating dioxygenase large terminal subunit